MSATSAIPTKTIDSHDYGEWVVCYDMGTSAESICERVLRSKKLVGW